MLLLLRLSGLEWGLFNEFQFRSFGSQHPTREAASDVNTIEVLTGLTGLAGLPRFFPVLQRSGFEAGPNKLTTIEQKKGLPEQPFFSSNQICVPIASPVVDSR